MPSDWWLSQRALKKRARLFFLLLHVGASERSALHVSIGVSRLLLTSVDHYGKLQPAAYCIVLR